MSIRVPAAVGDVIRGLRRAGFEAVVVGGAVRDSLLGMRPLDWDVATSARPQEVEAVFDRTIPTGAAFGTVTVRSRDAHIQVTTYRTESAYDDRRRPRQVTFVPDLRFDLARRDFTINAMAYDLAGRRLIDPFGGKRDLRARVLRAVGLAEDRFSEDVLRAVRAGRFIAQLGFRPSPAITRAARRIAHLIPELSAERIRDEMVKLLLSPRPGAGLIWMERAGLLRHIFPELLEGKGVRQGGWHRYDVWNHTLRAVDAARPDLSVRLALLLHDVAKPRTRTRAGGRYHFYKHERVGAEMAGDILRRLRFPRKEIEDVSALIRHHLFEPQPLALSEAALRRFLHRIGPERAESMLELRRADIVACGPTRKVPGALLCIRRNIRRMRRAQEALKIGDLALDGRDVMSILKIPPGPAVGRILKAALEAVLEKPSLNNSGDLSDLIRRLGGKGQIHRALR